MYIVFSDLDGTLLDHDTYDYQPSREGLALLFKKGIPLVLVSSKTLAEMEILHEELGLQSPFIFENGGGICWPERKESVEYIGMNVAELKSKRGFLEEELGEAVSFITDMGAEEIANRTGLSRDRALLSQRRLTSLPFIIPSGRGIATGELETIDVALKKKGLSMTKGGRFYHFLSSRSDKGSSITRVIDFYRKNGGDDITSIGIGDSENDIAMFKVVDIPVAVRKKDGSIIKTGIEHILHTSGIGPEGFSEAIKEILGVA